DDAEIGVRSDVPPRGVDRLEDEATDAAFSSRPECGADGVGAQDELAIGQAGEVPSPVYVSGLLRHDLHQAGGLRRGGHHLAAAHRGGSHRTRAPERSTAARSRTRETISDATSPPVARSRAIQPGIPFTSATRRPPLSLSRRSTPA